MAYSPFRTSPGRVHAIVALIQTEKQYPQEMSSPKKAPNHPGKPARKFLNLKNSEDDTTISVAASTATTARIQATAA